MSSQELILRDPDLGATLPQPGAGVPDDADYQEIATSFLASIANAGGFLVPSEYRAYGQAVGDIRGEQEQYRAQIRVQSLRYLLSPPPNPEKLLQRLVAGFEAGQVAFKSRLQILDGLLSILRTNPQPPDAGLRLAISLIESLRVPLNDYAGRIDAIRARSLRPTTMTGVPSSNGLMDWTVSFVSGVFGAIGLRAEPAAAASTAIGTPGGELNDQARNFAEGIAKVAKLIDSDRLLGLANELLQQLRPHPFRIVIAGEMKHGKSCIFNRILQQQLSPTGAGTATTSAVIELHYADHPAYEGRWLSEESMELLLTYVEEHKNNPAIRQLGEHVRAIRSQPAYSPGGQIRDLQSLPRMIDFVSAHGQYALAVERVRIGLPLPGLQKGAIIVDTPGVNDPVRIRDRITLEEAKRADCLVFVMRADKLGTESERQFLLSLLRSGQMLTLLVVLTHVDRLSSPEEVQRVNKAAEDWLRNVAEEAGRSEDLGGWARRFAFDARSGAPEVLTPDVPGYAAFWQELERIASDPQRCGSYAQWLDARKRELTAELEAEKQAYLQRVHDELPKESVLDAILQLTDRFLDLAQGYARDLQTRLNDYKERLLLDRKELMQDLDLFKERAAKRLADEVEIRVEKYGEDYALPRRWLEFDKTTCNELCCEELRPFHGRVMDKMENWQNALRRFSDDMTKTVESHSAMLTNAQDEFIANCSSSQLGTLVACKVDRAAQSIRKFATLGMGATMGYGLSRPLETICTLVVRLPTATVAAVAVVGLAAAWDWLSNPDKRKREFRERKVAAAQQWLDRHYASFAETLDQDLVRVWEDILQIVDDRCRPLLEESLAAAQESKLYCDVMRRLRDDSVRFLQSLG